MRVSAEAPLGGSGPGRAPGSGSRRRRSRWAIGGVAVSARLGSNGLVLAAAVGRRQPVDGRQEVEGVQPRRPAQRRVAPGLGGDPDPQVVAVDDVGADHGVAERVLERSSRPRRSSSSDAGDVGSAGSARLGLGRRRVGGLVGRLAGALGGRSAWPSASAPRRSPRPAVGGLARRRSVVVGRHAVDRQPTTMGSPFQRSAMSSLLDALLEQHDALEQGLGPGRAAGHVDVDGDDLVDALGHRVAVPVRAAAVGAASPSRSRTSGRASARRAAGWPGPSCR